MVKDEGDTDCFTQETPQLRFPRIAGATLARFLDDLTPLSSAASFLRCLAHFEKFLIAEEHDEQFSPWTDGLCICCSTRVLCKVQWHEHIQRGEFAAIVYLNRDVLPDEKNDNIYFKGYAWVPSEAAFLCLSCFQEHRTFDSAIKEWRVTRCFCDNAVDDEYLPR